MRQHNRNRVILLACSAAVVAWSLIVAFLIVFSVGVIREGGATIAITAGLLLCGAIGAGTTYLYYACTLRCEECGKKLFVEPSVAIHAASRKISGIDYWASAVIDAVWRRQITCMHCGTRYSLHNRNE